MSESEVQRRDEKSYPWTKQETSLTHMCKLCIQCLWQTLCGLKIFVPFLRFSATAPCRHMMYLSHICPPAPSHQSEFLAPKVNGSSYQETDIKFLTGFLQKVPVQRKCQATWEGLLFHPPHRGGARSTHTHGGLSHEQVKKTMHENKHPLLPNATQLWFSSLPALRISRQLPSGCLSSTYGPRQEGSVGKPSFPLA